MKSLACAVGAGFVAFCCFGTVSASGPGYPQDRRVYATWDKPVVVLCNQNSFSNTEIFSHAIKSSAAASWSACRPPPG
ncbi:MAG: hypothetical protein HY000_01935 [Planctomycetes bacterium]|nr:hypothetical protein [Planctomycetota bacterium]